MSACGSDEGFENQEQDQEVDVAPVSGVCPICHAAFQDPCFVYGCFHSFCYNCILQWRTRSCDATCPVCRGTLNSVVRGVRGDNDFELVRFSAPVTSSKTRPTQSRVTSRLRYSWGVPLVQRSGLEQRQRVYIRRLRSRPLGSGRRSVWGSILHDSERLTPWIERELGVLLGDVAGDLSVVSAFVLRLLRDRNSSAEIATQELRPFLSENAELFVHELECFAAAPYDMATFDRLVTYDASNTHHISLPTPADAPSELSCARCAARNELPRATCVRCRADLPVTAVVGAHLSRLSGERADKEREQTRKRERAEREAIEPAEELRQKLQRVREELEQVEARLSEELNS